MNLLLKGKKMYLLTAVLLVIALMFTSCGGVKTTSQSGDKAQPAIAYYAFNSEPVLDWDPSVEFSNGIIVMNNVYETLLKFDPLANHRILQH